jgi:hypothetical protein
MKSAARFFVCMAVIGSAQLKLSPTPMLSPTPIYAQAPEPPRDQTAPAARGGGRIVGRVITADTGNPIARARVQISSSALPKPRLLTTDANGRYEATGLGAGRYRIQVVRPGFVTLEYGQTRPSQSGRELELVDGQTLNGIDFLLSRGGVITGRITDHNGEPQAGIPMSALRLSWKPNGTRQHERLPMSFFERTLTDDLGQYRIYGLSPGSYIVAAGADARGVMGMPEFPVQGTTYFPGTANVDEAQSVEVEIGQDVPVHFALAASPLARISGTILDSSGRPVAWRSVMLATRTERGFGTRTAATTRPDGTFDIPAVPPGNYTIEVEPLRTQPDDFEFASFPISVEGHDITDLMISMKVGATVNGRVIWEGSSPQPFATQRITPATADGRMAAATPASGGGTVDAKGNFSLVGVHGPVVFHSSFVGRSEPWTLKAVRIGGADITDIGYNVTSDIDGLEVVMTDRETRVSGTARGEGYQPAMEYVVVILPSEVKPGVSPIRFIHTAQPDQQGRYQVKGLPPGRYVAAAVESLSSDGHHNPAFQKRVRSTATPFTLIEGQQLVLDLQLMQ